MTTAHAPPYRVLVVEDDRDVGSMLVDLLQGHGYQVRHMGTGRTAIAALTDGHTKPDAILLDYELGDMQAPEVLTAVGPHLGGIPVVLMSAHANGAQLAADVAIACYVAKPFDPLHLLEVLDRCIAGAQQAAAL